MQRREFFKTTATAAAVGLSYTLAGAEETAQTGNQYQPIYAGRKGKTVPGWGDQAVEHFTGYNPDFADKNLFNHERNMIRGRDCVPDKGNHGFRQRMPAN